MASRQIVSRFRTPTFESSFRAFRSKYHERASEQLCFKLISQQLCHARACLTVTYIRQFRRFALPFSHLFPYTIVNRKEKRERERIGFPLAATSWPSLVFFLPKKSIDTTHPRAPCGSSISLATFFFFSCSQMRNPPRPFHSVSHMVVASKEPAGWQVCMSSEFILYQSGSIYSFFRCGGTCAKRNGSRLRAHQ